MHRCLYKPIIERCHNEYKKHNQRSNDRELFTCLYLNIISIMIKIEFHKNLSYKKAKVEGLYIHTEKAFYRRIQIEKNLPPLHKLAVIIHELIHYFICRIFGTGSILHKVLDKTDINIW